MLLGNTHDETRAFIAPDSAKLAGLNWDNVAERMAPELKVDILPEWVVAEYRAHFPNWSPRDVFWGATTAGRSEEHTSELQSLMRISYAVFCLKKNTVIQTRRTRRNGCNTTQSI